MAIMGDNLLELEDLEPKLADLTGDAGSKPLECVGTPQARPALL